MIPKFKAYDLTENEWINLGRIVLCEKGELWYLQGLDENFKDIDPPYFKEDLGKAWVLLQSTGLFDKNGKEIYEGDILKENSMVGIVKFGRYLDYEYIQYGLDGWLFSEKLKLGFVDTPLTEYVLDPHCSIEVIGNKFEHPHLLEEE
ncbi:YopX family protein [Mammaliicoccus sp. J-M40]|uniref:YopX family protein n=1 Tax=Mammaliicoccus sp. J-M40 TaxID=2898699 RepID=UPI001EFA7C25|nr:YopX family protein [Mammaliicoccus sp. J-M40]